MCGIVGYTGRKNPIDILVEGPATSFFTSS